MSACAVFMTPNGLVSGRPLWAGPLYHVVRRLIESGNRRAGSRDLPIAELVTRAAPTWLASRQIQVSRRPASLDW
jgi:hypothetical protein